MPERVDKQWKDRGLAAYSTEAILGTLNHYGVQVDEQSLRAAAPDTTPLVLAGEWKAVWKGTGQFSTFPYAAANELLGRLFPDRPTPMRAAASVLELSLKGVSLASGTGATAEEVEALLATVEPLMERLPPPGDLRDGFSTELVGFLEAHADAFNELPVRLAKAGHGGYARRVAAIQEALFPDRAGCVTAVVRAHDGDREAAVADLTSWVQDPAREVFARYFALDALYQLDEWPPIIAHGLPIFDDAANAQRWVLADAVAHLLAQASEHGDAAFTREVQSRLRMAHHHTGGHH